MNSKFFYLCPQSSKCDVPFNFLRIKKRPKTITFENDSKENCDDDELKQD